MNKNGTFGTWLTWKAGQYKDDLDMSRYLIRNECALREGWQACAESNQADLDKANAEVEYYLSAYRLAHKQAMDNGQDRDKANARIAQLEEALKILLDEARYQSERGGWTERYELDVAIARLAESSDTWLLEHDKAVEIKVLEEAANSYLSAPNNTHPVEWLRKRAEARK